MNEIRDSLSFDDVLIEPRFSKILSRKLINLSSNLSKDIKLYLPLISSPMDTITEAKMAIAMAIRGGIGIIHRYNTISEQVSHIHTVKRYLSFIIEKPYTIFAGETISDLLEKIKRYCVYSYLVTNIDNELLGIVTRRDLNSFMSKYVSTDHNLMDTPIYKIMTGKDKLFIADSSITREDALAIMNEHRIEKLPLSNSGKIDGLIIYKNLVDYNMNKNIYSLDKSGQLLVGASIGIVGDYIDRARALIEAGCNVICIDVANGYHNSVADAIISIRKLSNSNDICIMAGNVCNAEGFEFLCRAGADCIRVGIGAGSICSTRLMTGVGAGQFSALLRCRSIARKYNVCMISDGGHLGKDGNISKALVVGANMMMLGGTLSATDETPGDIIYRNGKRVKCYRGMASALAMKSKSEITGSEYTGLNHEGEDFEVDVKGPVSSILSRIESNIKSTMSYIGAKDIKELRDIEDLIVFNRQSTGMMISETIIRRK